MEAGLVYGSTSTRLFVGRLGLEKPGNIVPACEVA